MRKAELCVGCFNVPALARRRCKVCMGRGFVETDNDGRVLVAGKKAKRP